MNPEQNPTVISEINTTQPVPVVKKFNLAWILIPLFFILGTIASLIAVKLYPEYFEKVGILSKRDVVTQNDNQGQNTPPVVTDDISAENNVVYEYTLNNKKYQLLMPNDERYTFNTNSAGTLIVSLGDNSELQITLDKVPVKNELGGIYGEVVKKVTGKIYRNSYFGYFYLLDLAPNCDPVITERPCVGSYFHNDEKGAFKAYLVNNKAQNKLTTQTITDTVDKMISKYTIKEIN
jgi:hypothetical protein